MEKETSKASERILSASLGAIHKRRLVEYAERRGLSIAEALRRMIDKEVPEDVREPQG